VKVQIKKSQSAVKAGAKPPNKSAATSRVLSKPPGKPAVKAKSAVTATAGAQYANKNKPGDKTPSQLKAKANPKAKSDVKTKSSAKSTMPAKKSAPAPIKKGTAAKKSAGAKPQPKNTTAKPAGKAVSKPVSKPVPKTIIKAKTASPPPLKVAPRPTPKPVPKALAKAVEKPKKIEKSVVPNGVANKQPDSAVPVTPLVRPVAAPSNGLPVPPPLKPGRRSSSRSFAHMPPPAPMVPTHAPDAAKASYSTMTERLAAPPPHVAAKKDPKLANNWKTKAAEALTDEEVKAMPDSEYMNEKQLAFFRAKLSVQKQEIHNSAGATTEHLREDTVVVPDPADRATIEEEHALELRTRDRERKLLKKIEQSIGRIDSGDYGYCDETGEPIGVGRLIARPTASLSLEAQQRRELKQKMFGD
jgi:DnaK suppressor protein